MHMIQDKTWVGEETHGTLRHILWLTYFFTDCHSHADWFYLILWNVDRTQIFLQWPKWIVTQHFICLNLSFISLTIVWVQVPGHRCWSVCVAVCSRPLGRGRLTSVKYFLSVNYFLNIVASQWNCWFASAPPCSGFNLCSIKVLENKS